ncbi:putative NRPS-like protein biosynthetic cluster [Pyricularia oryzae]|uniref:NRPS-like protein biosynthetic cluster n=1 Tax=Pyricularia grisea TaxID=148305 RepID=A0ABQ8NZP7_PYRGI|nr:putative NRPS-like protein biosynthetic cluster [Pyricularia oryzae]KAI6304426.1 putative NRPS-like protein biosynthetic cluster [Pyricularia grisea]KAI6288333.1 putative NRPS-like protein biosynthetic cluster [Pyricularia oryzae]KAI6339609.1 putative NRPS-like protein biosynthetic cluster [Pyricularia oryzae]KAI6375615.1 putative NRPS-like protein biosynthetic cluster [Pyricularia oryzae]
MNSSSLLRSDGTPANKLSPRDHLYTAELFTRSVTNWPGNIALVCAHQAPDLYGIPSEPTPEVQGQGGEGGSERLPYLRWTFRSLNSGVERLRGGLGLLGAPLGTAVATFMPNCAEFVLTWWAARGMGLVMAPLNPRSLSNKDEVEHQLATIVKGTCGRKPIIMVFERELLLSEPPKSTPGFAKIFVSGQAAAQAPERNELPFEHLMSAKTAANGVGQGLQPTDDEILFTSGSTSRPKAIKMEHPTLSLGMKDFAASPGCDREPGDLWLSFMPNNHGMGRSAVTSPMCSGGGVVYPGFYFNVAQVVDPSARGSNRPPGRGGSLLRSLYLSGAPPTPADLEICSEVLGVRSITSVYGMTEGAEANTAGCTDWSKLVNDKGMLSVGRPRSRGASLKVCSPGATGPDRPPLPIETPGEIHYCGPHRLPRPTVYMERPDEDEFCYTDPQGQRWLVTGDMGLVDEGGQLYIIGRSKDMIIRGGENIAPAAIESCLAENPNLSRLAIQIVGAPDPIAGQVPVAVIEASAEKLKLVAKEIHDTVLAKMGPMFVPTQILPLQALGLATWPRTATGKIKKPPVADAAERLLRQQEDSESRNDVGPGGSKIKFKQSLVIGIWSRSVGLPEASLSLQQPVAQFADSLTIARVVRRIRRQIPGCASLSAQELMRAETIKEQSELVARLADAQGQAGRNSEPPFRPTHVERDGPPGVDDMVHLTEHPNLLNETKDLVIETIRRDGFGWNDVEDIFPAQSCVSELGRSRVIDSAKFHFVDLMTAERDPERVKTAVQTMLRHNRILASYLIWDHHQRYSGLDPKLALHVTLKHNQKLFDHVVEIKGTINTVDDLQALAINCPEPQRGVLPGNLFRALIYEVEETGTVGLFYIVSHAVLDASSIWMFQEDLDTILSGKQLQPHVDYKLWADAYYSFRASPHARKSLNWHARYLNGLESHLDKALWPPIPPRGEIVDQTGKSYPDGVHYTFKAPDIAALRKSHPDIQPPVVLKSALALLIVWHTGHTHALFASCEDGRTKWPFMPPMPKDQAGMFADAQEVAGPTIQFVTNLVRISPAETVLGFLRRMQDDQDNLTRHAFAPWPELERAVGVDENTIQRIFTTIKFNWVPGFGAQAQMDRAMEPFPNLRILAAVARWRIGLLCRLGLGGTNSDVVAMHLIGDALKGEQKARIAKSLESLTRWLTSPEQWGAPIGGFKAHVDGKVEHIDEEGFKNMTRNHGLSCLAPSNRGSLEKGWQ